MSEEESRALSSLSDVVLEANKPSRTVDRNGQLAEVTTFLSPNATTGGILIKIWLITSIFLKHARMHVCGEGEGGGEGSRWTTSRVGYEKIFSKKNFIIIFIIRRFLGI